MSLVPQSSNKRLPSGEECEPGVADGVAAGECATSLSLLGEEVENAPSMLKSS